MPADSKSVGPVWSAAGGPGRAGLFPGPVRLSPEPVRRLAAHGAVQASVVFDAQGSALVADMTGWVQGFSVRGRKLWQRQLEGGISASPATDAERRRLFIGTHAGWVYALSSQTGEVLWSRNIAEGGDARVLSDLLYLSGERSVVLSSWTGQFQTFDAESGRVRHSWGAGLWPQSGATADAGENLYCLRAVPEKGVVFFRVSSDGKETILYSQPESPRGAHRMLVAAAPVLDEPSGVAYFLVNGDRECVMHAWSMAKGEHVWKCDLPHTVVAALAVSNTGDLLVADMTGSVRGIAGGAPVFCYATGTDYLLGGPVCSADGSTFVGDTSGRLLVIQRDGRGESVFECSRSIQARAAFDRHGNLYLPSTDGNVYVFDNQAG